MTALKYYRRKTPDGRLYRIVASPAINGDVTVFIVQGEGFGHYTSLPSNELEEVQRSAYEIRFDNPIEGTS